MTPGVFTVALIIVTVLISLACFKDERLKEKLLLWPARMRTPGEMYRLLTSGFVHADLMHLAFNMITLFYMGKYVELGLIQMGYSPWMYVLFYLIGIVVSDLPSYLRHRDSYHYRSLGASGGVAAVIFALVYFEPWAKISFMLPGLRLYNILFAVLYLVFTAYMARRGQDNINHDAHFWGSVYGLVAMVILDPTHGQSFLEALRNNPFL